jgi:hypothetical protein
MTYNQGFPRFPIILNYLWGTYGRRTIKRYETIDKINNTERLALVTE